MLISFAHIFYRIINLIKRLLDIETPVTSLSLHVHARHNTIGVKSEDNKFFIGANAHFKCFVTSR